MYSFPDSSFQGILYKPNIQDNPNLDKNFIKKRKLLFQSLNIRKPHQTKPFDEHPFNLSPSLQNNNKSVQKLYLPDIYLYQKPKHQEIIPIEETNKIVKQISKSLNFINKKIPVLNFDFLNTFEEETKSISYESEVYIKELQLMNMIFSDCGIVLKPRDVMVLEGQKSKSKYIIFTSCPKHPQSLCCQSEIVIKHIKFLSAKKFSFSREKSFEIPLKSLITLSCMKCGRQIMKIRPSQNADSGIQNPLNKYQERKRSLNYSKLISSGRFKKTLINDESVELMKSRKNPLQRSKTRMSKLQEISQSQKVNNQRYGQQDREMRVKSHQESINLKKKTRDHELQSLIKKRKHNISQIFVRKDL